MADVEKSDVAAAPRVGDTPVGGRFNAARSRIMHKIKGVGHSFSLLCGEFYAAGLGRLDSLCGKTKEVKERIMDSSFVKRITGWYEATPWNMIGFLIFLFLSINSGVAWILVEEGVIKDGETKQVVPFTFVLCVVLVTAQAILYYFYKLWMLKYRKAKVALWILTIETIYLVMVASAMESNETYDKYKTFCLGPLPTMVVGIVAFFPAETKEEIDQTEVTSKSMADKNELIRQLRGDVARKDERIKQLIEENETMKNQMQERLPY